MTDDANPEAPREGVRGNVHRDTALMDHMTLAPNCGVEILETGALQQNDSIREFE